MHFFISGYHNKKPCIPYFAGSAGFSGETQEYLPICANVYGVEEEADEVGIYYSLQ